jgi:hypothetical protein
MDEVYVIYLDGKMYKNSSKKIVYLTKGRAKSVVTSESKHMAEEEYWENNNHKHMFELSKKEQEILINKQKQRFKIKTFVPKDNSETCYMGEMPKKPRPTLNDEDIEYNDLEPSIWHPRRIVNLKGKISEIKRADNVIYKEKEDDD